MQNSAVITVEHYYQFLSRGSDSTINLTFGDFESSEQSHLPQRKVFVRDSAKVIIKH